MGEELKFGYDMFCRASSFWQRVWLQWEVAVSNAVLLLLVGCAYVVLVGGLSLLRREGLSLRLAVEAALIILLAIGLVVVTGLVIHPVLFLLFLYVVTMRVRILVDLGSAFARSKRFPQAEGLFKLASRLQPDQTGKLIIRVNQGTLLLQQGNLDEAIEVLRGVLEHSTRDYLGVKYEVAAHYNLGVAYLRKKLEAQATVEFNAVLEAWPASEFARRAASALEQHRRKSPSVPGKEE